MTWVELTDSRSDKKLWINMALVTSIGVSRDRTQIRFGGKDTAVSVKETPKAILAAAGVVK
jgi:hypothetical protein